MEQFFIQYRKLTPLGLGALAVFYSGQGIATLAVPYYQMTLGVDPFLLSLVLTIPLFMGTTFSTFAGHLSDNWRSPYGRRKPFLVAASLTSGLLYGCVWMVPSQWSDIHKIVYLACFSTLFYISSAFYNAPFTGLLYEVSENPQLRAKAIAFTAYFYKLGSIAYQWVFPLSQLAIFTSVSTGVITIGWMLSLCIFTFCGLAPALFFKEPSPFKNLPMTQTSFRQHLQAVWRIPSLRYIFMVVILQMGGAAYAASMDYYLLVYFVSEGNVDQGAIHKAILSSSYAIIGLIYVPILARSAERIGLINTLIWVFVLNAMGGLVKWWLFTPDWVAWVWADAILCSAVWGAVIVTVPTIISKIAHSENLGTGLSGAALSWFMSLGAIITLLGMGATLKLIGFDAEFSGQQAKSTLTSMRIILSGGTFGFSVLCLAVLLTKKDLFRKAELR